MAKRNKNTDPLETFFKQQLEDQDISYDEQDWLKLEERLDSAERVYAARIRRRWMAAAAILVLALLSYFMLQNRFNINRINQKITEQTPSEHEQERKPENNIAEGAKKSTLKNQQKDTGMASEKAPMVQRRAGEHSAEKVQSGVAGKNKPEYYIRNIAAVRQIEITKTSGSPILNPLSLPFNKSYLINNQKKKLALTSKTSQKTKVYTETILADHQGTFAPSVTGNGVSRGTFQRFSIGFVMSPDVSTVGSLSHFTSPGYKFGLTLEYNLSSDFSISTGITRSKIYYTAYSNEVNFPAGSGSSDNLFYNTDGACTLLDIPINLKYNFLHFSRSRFFATAGISSYIMLNERYNFNYESNNKGALQSWNENTGTSYVLSNANFSIGYEFDLLPSLSLRIEPFIKIPMRGVGWEKVRLYSMGSFISFNYKL